MSGRYERELVNALDALGWGVMRAPSSGSATARELPDVLALEGREREGRLSCHSVRQAWAIEHKSGVSSTLYVGEGEVEALTRFCRATGTVPLLCARPTTQATGTDHYLVRPRAARRTQGVAAGNYGLPVAELRERAFVVVSTGDEPAVEVVA